MNNYTKLLVNLVNVDMAIEEEDNALILLNSLSDEEYETFILMLINDKQSLNYSDVLVALVNYEVRKKDKQFSSNSTTTEVMTVRGMSFNHRKGKGEFEKSKTEVHEDLKKNQCASYRKEELWKINCSKIKPKNKESKSEANIT